MSTNDGRNEENQVEEKPSFIFLYIAIGCFAVGALLLALSFFIKGAGAYMLIACMISELAAVSFLNGQKRKGENTACRVIRILSYVIMAAALIICVIGVSVTQPSK